MKHGLFKFPHFLRELRAAEVRDFFCAEAGIPAKHAPSRFQQFFDLVPVRASNHAVPGMRRLSCPIWRKSIRGETFEVPSLFLGIS